MGKRMHILAVETTVKVRTERIVDLEIVRKEPILTLRGTRERAYADDTISPKNSLERFLSPGSEL